jgi:hypothetical protein
MSEYAFTFLILLRNSKDFPLGYDNILIKYIFTIQLIFSLPQKYNVIFLEHGQKDGALIKAYLNLNGFGIFPVITP